MGESDYEEADGFDEEGFAALEEMEAPRPVAKQKVSPTNRGPLLHNVELDQRPAKTQKVAYQAPAYQAPVYKGHLQQSVDLSEEAELRRLEGAPPPSIDLTDDDAPVPSPTSDVCHTCGLPGHWARDCPTKAAEQGPSMDCPCGMGKCSVLTAKTERNAGRQFFKCPVREGCNFFSAHSAPPRSAPLRPVRPIHPVRCEPPPPYTRRVGR